MFRFFYVKISLSKVFSVFFSVALQLQHVTDSEHHVMKLIMQCTFKEESKPKKHYKTDSPTFFSQSNPQVKFSHIH